MLAAEWRGLRSIDPRWDEVARRISGIALFLGAVVAGLLGVGLGIIQILFYPRQTEHLLTIFFPLLIGGWASYIAGMVFLAVYHFGWSQGRGRRKWHAAFGIFAVLYVWAAASVLVSLQSFTLTTGAWPGSGALRSAFYNPSAVPSFFYWAGFSLAVAGAAGLVYGSFQKDPLWRAAIVKGAGAGTVAAAVLAAAGAFWWVFSVPRFARLWIFGGSFTAGAAGAAALILVILFVIFLSLTALRRPRHFGLPLALVAAVMLVAIGGAMEWTRWRVRRPYSIQGYMYATGILVSEVEVLNREGVGILSRQSRGEGADGPAPAGVFSFRMQCLPCHGEKVEKEMPGFRREGEVLRFLDEIRDRHPNLPLFVGTEEEKVALSDYIEGLLKTAGVALVPPPALGPAPASGPAPAKADTEPPPPHLGEPPPPAAVRTEPAPVVEPERIPEKEATLTSPEPPLPPAAPEEADAKAEEAEKGEAVQAPAPSEASGGGPVPPGEEPEETVSPSPEEAPAADRSAQTDAPSSLGGESSSSETGSPSKTGSPEGETDTPAPAPGADASAGSAQDESGKGESSPPAPPAPPAGEAKQ